MKHGERMAIGLAGALVWLGHALAVSADTAGNPYAGIVDRNIFALKPTPVIEPTKSAEALPQKIIPTGIVNAFGKKQALFKITMLASPGQAAREQSFMWSEGDRLGEIELLEINEAAGTLKFNNHGMIELKDLVKDGLKPAASPGAVPGGAVPGAGIPGASVANANPMPGGGAVPAFSGGNLSVARPLRVPSTTPTTAAGYAAAMTPTGVPAQNANVPAKPTMTPEEQIVLMEINRKLTEGQVARGEMPPLPPTPFTPGPPPVPGH